MPVFEYIAVSSSGGKVKGQIDADGIRAARQKLRAQGIFPTEVREGTTSIENRSQDIKRYFQTNRVSGGELAVATRQLSTLVGAGLPLINALQALFDQTESAVLKRILVKVRDSVEEGSSLAKALSAYPKAFPRLYVNLVASGEASGTLDAVLENLADHLESQGELKRKILSALTYPILMLCICSLVIVALLTFVVPKIVEIFQKQHLTLPLPTEIVLAVSHFLINYWYLILAALACFIFGTQHYYRQEKGREAIDRWLMKLPIFGRTYTKVATARVCRTLSTLLSSGVELLTALDITKNIVGNIHFVRAIESAHDGVREGRSLANEFTRSQVFPVMVCHMIAVGEKSGELEKMLSRASKAYENEVNATLSGLTSILEPVMMIVVGAIVLFIVLSVLLPMTDMIGKVR